LNRARFARQSVALIMLDLDHFKSINDRYGHDTGDEVLKAFCRLATSQLRPNDLFGRIGGEEFASLLPDTGHHDAVRLAERVRSAVETSAHAFGQHAFDLTVSVGVAMSDEERSDLSALMDSADKALYRAKKLGRNRVSRRRIGPSSGRPNNASLQSNINQADCWGLSVGFSPAITYAAAWVTFSCCART
jgi:diguanylate cyclase (GGDEF)-like protein